MTSHQVNANMLVNILSGVARKMLSNGGMGGGGGGGGSNFLGQTQN